MKTPTTAGEILEAVSNWTIGHTAVIKALHEAGYTDHAHEIHANLEAEGILIRAYDILIAAQAHPRGALLVTANGWQFERVPGLLVLD